VIKKTRILNGIGYIAIAISTALNGCGRGLTERADNAQTISDIIPRPDELTAPDLAITLPYLQRPTKAWKKSEGRTIEDPRLRKYREELDSIEHRIFSMRRTIADYNDNDGGYKYWYTEEAIEENRKLRRLYQKLRPYGRNPIAEEMRAEIVQLIKRNKGYILNAQKNKRQRAKRIIDKWEQQFRRLSPYHQRREIMRLIETYTLVARTQEQGTRKKLLEYLNQKKRRYFTHRRR